MKKNLFVLLSILLITCKSSKNSSEDTLFISLEIDSCSRYFNKNVSIENFIFSPIDSNVVWILNTNGPAYELRLSDSSWTPLSLRWDEYSFGLKEEGIVVDSIDRNLLWIANFHRGLIVYNIDQNNYNEFVSIKPVSVIFIDTIDVFVGTWQGIYQINRKTMNSSKSISIAEISVRQIEKIYPGILLINDKYEYDYKRDKILKTRTNTKIETEQWNADDKIVSEKITYNEPYLILQEMDENGSYSHEYFAFNKPALKFRFDSKYVYFNTWHSFEIYNRSYLFRDSQKIRNPATDIKTFDSVIYALHLQDLDFPDYYNTVKQLNAVYENSPVNYIQNRINSITGTLVHFSGNFNEIVKLEKFVTDSVAEDSIKAAYYLRIIYLANYELKLGKSLKYDELLEKHFPIYRNDAHKKEVKIVSEFYHKIERVKNSPDLSEDEILWQLGSEYYEFYKQVIYPKYETTLPDMAYPFHFLDSLLVLYPESIYADNAKFLMINFYEQASHDHGGYYNVEAIEEYKSILKKYPDTEHAAEIYHLISELYSYCDLEFSELPKYYRLALNYANKLLDEYPLYEKRAAVERLKEEVNEMLSKTLWSLEVQSDKEVYELNEPVFITFNLKNISSKTKSIKIWKDKDVPIFFLRVERYDLNMKIYANEALMEEDPGYYDKNKIQVAIEPNGSFTQTFDITARAIIDWHGPLVRFRLEEPGKYKITTYGSESGYDLSIPGNDVWITVGAKKIK